MNWEAIGAAGELVGSVAVLLTLFYLARQITHAREDVSRSINKSRAETVRDLLLTRATNPHLRDAYVKAYLGLDGTVAHFVTTLIERTGISNEEAAGLFWEQLAWWQYRLEVFSDVDALTPAQRDEFETGIRINYGAQPIERLFYTSMKDSFPRDAVAYIDGLIET